MNRILLSLGLLTAMGTATWAQGPLQCRLPRPNSVTTQTETAPDAVDPFNYRAYGEETEPAPPQRILTCGLEVWNENGDRLDPATDVLAQDNANVFDYYQTVLTYNFNVGSLEEISGFGPGLVPIANAEGETGDFKFERIRRREFENRYLFERNAGLVFNNAEAGQFLGHEYTIEIKFRFKETESWRRVLDFNDQTEDVGIYLKNGLLEFYGPATGQYAQMEAVQPGEMIHVVLIRRATKAMGIWEMEMYANGTHVLTVATSDESTIRPDGKLIFFQDDQQVMNEASAGAVEFIRIYNYALNPDEMTAMTESEPLRPEDLYAHECSAGGCDMPYEGIYDSETDPYALETVEPQVVYPQSNINPNFDSNGPLPQPQHLAEYNCQCSSIEFINEEPVAVTETPVEETITPATEPTAPVVDALPTSAETHITWVFYPNPATQGIFVRGIQPDAPLQVTLLDASGRTVPGLTVGNPDGNTVYIAWPAGTASGQYLLTVRQGTTTNTQRIVVQ